MTIGDNHINHPIINNDKTSKFELTLTLSDNNHVPAER